ncbi:MAG: phosphoribosylamine--glycine ligase, partial [Actinobacteria bacterium]|nr:phosphoribosylamine--glycine ligase [Actinomycetota bacterium]NIV57691.1 phosphoribosylamine--glycine ligase [Actinomycetota bacterium]NIX18619.1 phosphoribosylamine--glycine ligase [Actinomycetota bacterium]NIX52481.1 phosphoribosylamine--glycine ligase [Actinomycetota bacterium]
PALKGSLIEPFVRIARGESIEEAELAWNQKMAVCTVLASNGYPGPYDKGKVVEIAPELT